MSLLQEYENIRKQIGEDTYTHVNSFLARHKNEYLLSDVYYKPDVWAQMCKEEKID